MSQLYILADGEVTGFPFDPWELPVALFGSVSGTVAVTQANQTSTASGTVTPKPNQGRTQYMALDGNNDRANTPDHASFGGLTRISGWGLVRSNDYVPGSSLHQTVVSQSAAAPQTSWSMSINADGRMFMLRSFDGTASTTVNSTENLSDYVADGDWIYAGYDFDGATGDFRFYFSYDGSTWTQLGTTVNFGGTGTLHDSTAVLGIGYRESGGHHFNGSIAEVVVQSGALVGGTPFFHARFWNPADGWAPGETTGGTGTDAIAAHVITLVNQAVIVGLTQADQTSTASGTVTDPISGTVAVTQADQTSTATGILGYTGTLAVTQADQTSTASGVLGYSGSAAITQADQTSTATGQLGASGSLAVTQADQTSTASGSVTDPPITGTVAVIQSDQTSTASGTVVNHFSGTVAVTQADQTSTASGGTGTVGTVAVTQADQTSTASGTFACVGSATASQEDQTSTASGSVQPPISGTATPTQEDQFSTASGIVVNPIPDTIGIASPTEENDLCLAFGISYHTTVTVGGMVAGAPRSDTRVSAAVGVPSVHQDDSRQTKVGAGTGIPSVEGP